MGFHITFYQEIFNGGAGDRTLCMPSRNRASVYVQSGHIYLIYRCVSLASLTLNLSPPLVF